MIPKALQEQEEQANKIYEQAYADVEDPNAEEAEDEASEEVEEVEEEAAEEEQVVNWQDRSKEWETKYNALHGKYNAEVPRLAQELNAIKQHLASGAAPARVDESEDLNPESVFEQMREDYGEDLANDIRRFIRAESYAAIGPVANIATHAQQNALHMVRESYFNELTRLVPDWQEIVAEPEFAAFAGGADEFTGYPRYILMQGAEQNFDAHRIAAFYSAYKKQTGRPSANKSKKLAAVTPGGKASKGAGVAGGRDKYVSRQEMAQFAKDLSLNKYKGREGEAQKIQARIDKAIANGWVIP